MCGGAKWKREVVQDHKFDFVDTSDFVDNGFFMRLKYLWLYLVVLKSFMVYVLDIFSAITMLTTSNWSNEIFKQCKDVKGCVFIPFNTGKWLFVGCILVSFLLLAYESRKAKKIIASRDISFAFTNVMANNYYSLRSYNHFCFFDHISNSTKTSDDFAFFVFFVFKSWKRLLLADTPRQSINALTLYAVWLAKKDLPGEWYDVTKYFRKNSMSTSMLTITSFFTVAVCAGSLLLLLTAAICYVPLLMHIRGNLKEYCCHKVDKRIAEVIDKTRKERIDKQAKLMRKEAMGDFSHLKNKKGELVHQPLPQPTLPNLSVDDDDTSSVNTRVPAPSTYTQDYYHYNSDKAADYPPMPAYNPYSAQQGPGNYPYYNPSAATLNDEYAYPSQHLYDDNDNESTAHLTSSAAPFARDPISRQASPYGPPPTRGTNYDPVDVYQGRAGSTAPSLHQQSRRSPPASAYDDGQQNPYTQSPLSYGQPSPQQVNDPYYSSNPPPSVNGGRQPRGRGYDEEGGYGRGQGGYQRPM
ncbi:hypothetical protein BJ165DRAFT_1425252 [Panaeolus papilionaceus]|nr:hypothetical protein BJ165DRAFT_1425252 [Panaeolus papilionaceus]